jgi:parvulin-like peptidyl-prolyl isomerase
MRSIYPTVLVFFLMLAHALGQSGLANGIAVIVNDTVITYKDLEMSIGQEANLLTKQYAGQPAMLKEKLLALQKDGIEELVARQLILHEYKTGGYNLPESLIDDYVEQRIKQEFGDRVTMAKTLEARNTTFESYRRKIRDQIIIEVMTRQKQGTIEPIISPYKIENYFKQNQKQYQLGDQVKLRMIVLNKRADAGDTPTRLAQEIVAKLDSGTSFAEMASVYSEGSQRNQGGDWGWIERSVLRTNLADVAFQLKPGQHSGIIDTSEAIFIMLVEDVKTAHVKPMADVREEIERTLAAQEHDRAYRRWIERLKAKSFVRFF